MELKGQLPSIISGTLHGPGYSAGNAITKSYGLQNGRFDNDFHLFAVEWNESSIDFFVDDYMYQRIDRSKVTGEWVFDQSFFLIFNIAVGGNYVGFPTNQTPFPQKMTIDYVRVYKQQ
jgi:beta-glucanase (GH16 family)